MAATRTIVSSSRQAVTVISFDTETPSNIGGSVFFNCGEDTDLATATAPFTSATQDGAYRAKLLRAWWHSSADAVLRFSISGNGNLRDRFSLMAGTGYLDFRQWGGLPVADPASGTSGGGSGDIRAHAVTGTANITLMLEVGVV